MNTIDKIRIRYKIKKIARYTKGMSEDDKEQITLLLVYALRQLPEHKKESLLDTCISAVEKAAGRSSDE